VTGVVRPSATIDATALIRGRGGLKPQSQSDVECADTRLKARKCRSRCQSPPFMSGSAVPAKNGSWRLLGRSLGGRGAAVLMTLVIHDNGQPATRQPCEGGSLRGSSIEGISCLRGGSTTSADRLLLEALRPV